MKYLIVLLDDTSVSYCHYQNTRNERKLISLDDLKAGIMFAMKQNMMPQFVYPYYELPQSYKDLINTVDHSNIVPHGYCIAGDVYVVDGLKDCLIDSVNIDSNYALCVSKSELFDNANLIKDLIGKVARLNIVLRDIESFTSDDYDKYKIVLKILGKEIMRLYGLGMAPQLNLMTDRIYLSSMNNCDAGWNNITLAPDGCFYVCPAFYLNNGKSIGNVRNGIDIKNPQLYRAKYAPICRICDAFQCNRCIWLNQKLTLEVNTPSHQQCVVSHLERNASRELLNGIRECVGQFRPNFNIEEIDYLDPIDQIILR